MFYYLLYPLREYWFGFNVFHYITFRAVMANVTAFVLAVWMAPSVIGWLKRMKVGQRVRQREEVGGLYELHRHKEGTPTMGGLLILGALFGSTLLWGDLLNRMVILAVTITASLGLIGFLDDWAKLRQTGGRGLSRGNRLFWQGLIAMVLGGMLLMDPKYPTVLEIPFLKRPVVDLGLWLMPFTMLVLVGTSNAVNLADGLDGLAIGCTAMIALCLTVIAYLTGHRVFADYLLIPFIPQAGELTVFCAALVGASMGFLWYNCQPASVFMGDTGSLALGGAIGVVAILTKKELLLILLGGIFVVEALSVILQVGSFKLTGRRIFRMAPLHHHFQLEGWAESKVTIRFWIVGAILVLLSLGTLKLR